MRFISWKLRFLFEIVWWNSRFFPCSFHEIRFFFFILFFRSICEIYFFRDLLTKFAASLGDQLTKFAIFPHYLFIYLLLNSRYFPFIVYRHSWLFPQQTDRICDFFARSFDEIHDIFEQLIVESCRIFSNQLITIYLRKSLIKKMALYFCDL